MSRKFTVSKLKMSRNLRANIKGIHVQIVRLAYFIIRNWEVNTFSYLSSKFQGENSVEIRKKISLRKNVNGKKLPEEEEIQQTSQ